MVSDSEMVFLSDAGAGEGEILERDPSFSV